MPEWHIHVKNEMSSYNANVSRYRGDTDRDRPSSEQLVDLHVYIVPPDIWRDRYNNLPNQSVVETISVGIIRVHPESKVYILRDEIEQQVGIDLIPRDYVFLKSVGRSLTRLKPKQEYQVKVKHFLPPHAYAPELYILEATPDIRAGLVASSSENSTRPQTRTSINQADDSPRNSYSYRDSYQYGKNREKKVISSQRDKQGPDPKGLYDPRATYVTTTNEDSGIAGLTPDDHYREHYEDVLDRRKQEEDRRKRDADLQRQLDQDRARKEQEAAERHQRRREEYERANWEQCKKDEEKRKREERRRDQDNDKRYGDEKDKEKDRNVRKSGSQTDDELTRFPSPPQFRNASADKEDTESSKEIRSSKEKLLLELEAAKESRRKIEKEREELIKRVKQQQNKTHNRRNHARDLWKKKYFEEKKKTNPLEEQSNRFRNELEIIHRKLMSTLEGPREKGTKLIDLKPSRKSNYKISAAKLIHELEDLRRRMDNSKMKLTAEMKLRNQAETELRALRAELTQKKINLTLTRTQQLATLMPAPDLLMTTR